MNDDTNGHQPPLPPGWAWVKLGQLGRWTGGGTPSKSNTAFWTGGTIPWVSPKDMKSVRVGSSAERITSAAVANSATKVVEAGSILCVVRSGILKHTFPVAIAECDVTMNQDMRALTPWPGVSADYLRLFLQSRNDDILNLFAKDGTTVASIDPDQLAKMRVPLAPSAEQARIAARIDELFSEIEAGEQELQKVREGLDTYRRAVLKAAVAGELTRDWRVRGGADVSDHDRSHFGWCYKPVGDLGDVQLGRQRAPRHHLGPHMHPYLRVANVYENRIDSTDIMTMNFDPGEYERYRLCSGDILLNEGQSLELVGRPAMYRGEVPGACFTNTLVRFRPNLSLLPEFALLVFRAWMRDGTFRRIARITTNIAHLGAGRFARLPFPLPSVEEQHAIVQIAGEFLDIAEVGQSEIDAQFEAANRLRQSILSVAFAGKLVPQEPNSESPSAPLSQVDALGAVPSATKTRIIGLPGLPS